ncbi:partner of Y14 and mago isoform X1 [Dipodomys spectabilis]|uniref:partner of Y14 and mago isoform X1 n=1 Tax=Dipodomys spectabilis TaxID=105255 RepID=UPI001C549D29|nr:partner of Y14 and mago isoform X1 [Dipodomys spectabilis]
MFEYFCLFFSGTEISIQELMLTKLVLCYLSHASSLPFCFSGDYLEMESNELFCLGWPPTFIFQISTYEVARIYRHDPLALNMGNCLKIRKLIQLGFSNFRYENKYVKFFKSKPELPPGLSPEATTPVTPSRPEGGEPGLSKTAKRNLKRKEKRRQQQEKGEAEALSRTLEKVSLGETIQLPSALQITQAAPTAASDPPDSAATTEKAKKIKSLKKKLRQVEELQQRIQAGEVSQPSKEQLEKLARRRALEEELEDLELGL